MPTIYLSPSGKQCTPVEAAAFRVGAGPHEGQSPYLLDYFRNERLDVKLWALSQISIERDEPQEFWRRAEVVVNNIITTDVEGQPLPANQHKLVRDVGASKSFRTAAAARAYYNEFVSTWTDSRIGPDKQLVEVGNLAKPDLNVPTVLPGMDASEIGDW